jgi:hypothetical protein
MITMHFAKHELKRVLKHMGKQSDPPFAPHGHNLIYEIYYVYLEITTRETREFMGELKRFRKILM